MTTAVKTQQTQQNQQARPAEMPTALSFLAQYEPKGRAMSGGATFSSALDALRANRLRSFLTMLGMIIGVSAVISVVALTQGVNKSVSDRFANLGTNALTIFPGTTSSFGAHTAAGTSQTLTLADVKALEQIPHIINISPVLSSSEQVIYGDQNWSTSVRGVYPDFQTIQNWQLAEGSWFTNQDEQMTTPVAVLGQTVVQNLFPSSDPLGQTIRIGDQLFRVVGVLQPKGAQGAANSDDVIFVPFSAAYERLNGVTTYVNQIQLEVDNIANVAQVQAEVTTVLRLDHHLPGPDPSLLQQNGSQRFTFLQGGFGGGGRGGQGQGQGQGRGQAGGSGSTGSSAAARQTLDPPNDFQVLNVNQLIQTAQQNDAILTVLLIGIAGISLAVGGIGIMNIMLVSVTERIREIGIRIAIGARRRDIRNQFLLEAIMLSVVGGVIGIFIGLGGGLALTLGLGLPFVLSAIPALVAFSASAAVGIAFGLYPAMRAARLDPITALRTE